MKKIFVLYTGGTIGMVHGKNGLQPDAKLVETALSPFSGSLKFDWHICEPLIDSSAVSPENWQDWLSIVQNALPEYDGMLILHGTDTLAYTANIFALTLDTQGKPIVLTGSQRPFSKEKSDAPKNLQTAIAALQDENVREVVIAFNGKIFAAVGSSKVSTETDDGFANWHFGTNLHHSVAPFSGNLEREFSSKIKILPFYLTPAHGTQLAAQTLNTSDADAAILMSFGHGNAPDDADLLNAIQNFSQSGKIVLNISQAAQGCAAAVYAQGNALRQSGAINGGKCSVETATALLMLAAHNAWTADDVAQELRRLNLL